ncbi:MAG: hypothetical protein WC222_01015 [Parachlamydiales bacterium]|jgi:transcription elongation factor Elf1
MSKEQTIPFQKGHDLEFPCTHCGKDVTFSVFELDSTQGKLQCTHCEQNYLFNDPKLLHQLRLFENLCRQIHASEEILSNTSIGINVGSHAVEIPFKLLLTRFNSRLKLQMGKDEVIIAFRLEPQQMPVKK